MSLNIAKGIVQWCTSLSFFVVLLVCAAIPAYATIIAVEVSTSGAQVFPLVYGNNLLGHDGNRASNCGEGVFVGKWGDISPEIITLSLDAGISIFRFPGGCGTHLYDWKRTIGTKRKEYLFGIDEFLRVCEAARTAAIFTVSYFTGDEQDAADLVEYLNSSDDGLHPWARVRSGNGHLQPYGVRYFEIGNEVWHGDHKKIKQVSPESYAHRYLEYYNAMKAVDPSIKIGVILWTEEWNRRVMAIVRDKVDIGIVHIYPEAGVSNDEFLTLDPKTIYSATLAGPEIYYERELRNALALLQNMAGKHVPLAITEYNGGFVQDKPVPYRHALGTALLNAELLRLFMRPQNEVIIANYWNFVNEYWGMIANGFDGSYRTLNNPYYKRPNYFVFELYHKHFGSVLVDAAVQCGSYDVRQFEFYKSLVKKVKTGAVTGDNLAHGAWVIAPVGGVSVYEEGGVLEVEFLGEGSTLNYYHSTKTAQVEGDLFYKLSGYIKTDSLIDDNGVCLEVQDGRGWVQTHSAESTSRVKGTTDWQYVETIYQTLPDAREVRVIARRIGEKGPLKGKAYFKDVRLEKFIPSIDTKIPYLSVNASKSADGSKVFLMVINKNMDKSETATIELKDFIPAAEGNAWVLTGPSVDATNEKKHDNVKVTHKPFKVAGASFEYTFEPHSLTAIELTRAK